MNELIIDCEKKCKICGWERTLDLCHMGHGKEVHKTDRANFIDPCIYLCPNHHRLYDHHRLREEELNKLPQLFQEYYKASSGAIKRSIIRRANKFYSNWVGEMFIRTVRVHSKDYQQACRHYYGPDGKRHTEIARLTWPSENRNRIPFGEPVDDGLP